MRTPDPVRHHDVFALTNDVEPGLLQGPDRLQVGDPGDLPHRLRDFNLADLGVPGELGDNRQILANGVLDVLESFVFGRPLRPATRQSGDRDAEAFFGRIKRDFVFHGRIIPSYRRRSR
jgi:hypothetical protein